MLALLNGLRGGGTPQFERFDGSTWSPGPRGTRAVYQALQRRGYDVRRWEEEHLPEAENSTMVIIGPLANAPGVARVRALNEWIRGGNTAVYFVDARLGSRGVPRSDLLARFWRFRVSTRFNARLPERDGEPLSWKQWRAWRAEGIRLPLKGDSELLEGVDAVAVEVPARVYPESPWLPTPVRIDETAGQQPGPVLMRYYFGRGAVVIIPFASPVSNRLIDEAQNYRFFENIVNTRGRPRTVFFDEFVHDFHKEPQLARDGSGRPLLALLLQVMLWGGVFILARGRRFGPPVVPAPAGSQGKLEFAAGMGRLYARADARAFGIRRIYQDLAERAGFRSGELPDPARLAAHIARSTALEESPTRASLEEAARVIAAGSVGRARFMALARQMRSISATLIERPGRHRDDNTRIL